MSRRRRNLKRYWVVILLAIVAAIVGLIFWPDNDSKNLNTAVEQSSSANQPEVEQPSFPVINLQATIDTWVAKQSGRAGIVVYDLANKKIVASINPDRQYFTASLYKLYVAYIGYQKIADGTYEANDPYLSGYNRGKCLDEMIRSSYSPCREKMWSELGKQQLTEKLKTYGLTNTSMTGLYTSAEDTALILARLFERRDLTEAYTNAYLSSLKDQDVKFRTGLPSGFAKSAVYNKVGWNGTVEWHDAAIVTLPNNRSYVITVLSENIGSAQVASLGQAIEARLTQ